jgi:single-stranded DNA-binding protein
MWLGENLMIENRRNTNTFTIAGNIGKEPEISQNNGVTFVRFSLAHSVKKYKSEGFETEWHNCVARGKAKEDILKYLDSVGDLKGVHVELTGLLSARSFTDRSGIKRTAHELVTLGITFFEKRARGEAQPSSKVAPGKSFEAQASGIVPLDESDLPF